MNTTTSEVRMTFIYLIVGVVVVALFMRYLVDRGGNL